MIVNNSTLSLGVQLDNSTFYEVVGVGLYSLEVRVNPRGAGVFSRCDSTPEVRMYSGGATHPRGVGVLQRCGCTL